MRGWALFDGPVAGSHTCSCLLQWLAGSHWLLPDQRRGGCGHAAPAIMVLQSAAMMAIMIMKVSPPAPRMFHFLLHILVSISQPWDSSWLVLGARGQALASEVSAGK